MKISFIGFGNMAKALAKGLLENKANKLQAAAPSLHTGVNQEGIKTYNNNLDVLPNADIIILAVKPALVSNIITEIKSSIPKSCLIISIASGISLEWFSKHCEGIAVIRAMPNIAASIGKSATPLVANELVNNAQKLNAEEIFKSVGLTTWVSTDNDIDTFTALSGSGPAYVFMFMESMIKAAISLGIKEEDAKSFTLQTVNGALHLATLNEYNLKYLRELVTSPAGTTAAAINVLNNEGFDDTIYAALKAAYERAKELGRY